MAKIIVTRRQSFRRFERVQTLEGLGPLVEVPDYYDEENIEQLQPGESLEEAAKRYRADPAVVAIREDRG